MRTAKTPATRTASTTLAAMILADSDHDFIRPTL
jgi:hypothetical protein